VERIIAVTVLRHQEKCPVKDRVAKIELRLATLLGFMAGSGLLGGATGAVVARCLFGG
jgi:hypothetical protein